MMRLIATAFLLALLTATANLSTHAATASATPSSQDQKTNSDAIAAAPAVQSTGEIANKELIRAAVRGDMDSLKAALAGGADINTKDAEGWTPLMRAAWNGKTAIVLALLSNNADVKTINKGGETALLKAGQRGFTDIVTLLENAGAQKTQITLNDSEFPVPSLTPAQGWALATVAISNQQNGFSHYLLGGEPMTPQARANAIYGLKNWWGVTTREETLEVLEWLMNEGHHKEYEQLANVVGQASEADFQQLMTKYSDNPEVVFKLKFVKENRQRIGRKSLLAWDICRYIQVAGLGYISGYLTEEEAWTRIMPAAKILQDNFDSWSDMGDNYLMGRYYWAGERNDRLDYIYSLLTNEKDGHSPWNKYDWKTDLIAAQPPSEPEKPTAKIEPRADAN